MQLREFAKSILFEPSLECKLRAPTEPFDDSLPGPALEAAPSTPGRPSALALVAKDQRSRTSLRLKQFESSRERGLTLHAFANHELLALELMALALLRFPEAPSSFRLGLARTMLDEQKHLRLYKARMEALGIGLGEAPVNRFFWDCLATMASPLEFVVRMSMTLEQANLDFATYFEKIFRKVGDLDTARTLAEVHQDEIGHVKHGVVWFNRWRDPKQSAWDTFQEHLHMPLSPVRAKGPIFEEEARLAAGLSADFIETLRHYTASKGRPPTLFWFNAGWEEELAELGSPNAPRQQASRQNQVVTAIEHDLDALMLFVAKSDDIVWLRRKPSSSHLGMLRAAGIAIPQLISTKDELQYQQLDRFEPWGLSPRARAFANSLRVRFRQLDERPDTPVYASKTWATKLRETNDFPTRICTSLSEVESALFSGWSVVKAPFGASGRNAHRIHPNGLSPEQERWIKHTLSRQGELIVEPWVERIADFSVQLEVGNRSNPVLGITRFLTNSRGQYLGHVLNAPYAGLDPDIVRTLHERKYPQQLEETGKAVAKALEAAGHRGAAGIDAFLYRTQSGELALRPLVEVNARYTMGRIALGIGRYVPRGRQALWLHIPRRHLDLETLLATHPPQFRDGRLIAGILPTNDSDGASLLQTLLFLGPACGDVESANHKTQAVGAGGATFKQALWLQHSSRKQDQHKIYNAVGDVVTDTGARLVVGSEPEPSKGTLHVTLGESTQPVTSELREAANGFLARDPLCPFCTGPLRRALDAMRCFKH